MKASNLYDNSTLDYLNQLKPYTTNLRVQSPQLYKDYRNEGMSNYPHMQDYQRTMKELAAQQEQEQDILREYEANKKRMMEEESAKYVKEYARYEEAKRQQEAAARVQREREAAAARARQQAEAAARAQQQQREQRRARRQQTTQQAVPQAAAPASYGSGYYVPESLIKQIYDQHKARQASGSQWRGNGAPEYVEQAFRGFPRVGMGRLFLTHDQLAKFADPSLNGSSFAYNKWNQFYGNG